MLTVAQAAAELKISPRQVRQLITNGTLPAEKFGRDYMIQPADVEKVRVRPKPGRPPKKTTPNNCAELPPPPPAAAPARSSAPKRKPPKRPK